MSSFNMAEWCGMQRGAIAALRAELEDLRLFVRSNVLNADEASRVDAKIAKAVSKFESVEASSESIILAFEADSKEGRACKLPESGQQSQVDEKRDTQVIGSGDVGTLSGAETLASPLPGSPPDNEQGSAASPPTEAKEEKPAKEEHEAAHGKAHAKESHAKGHGHKH